MVQADLSAVSYFLPLLGFLVVFIISYFLIHASKLIEPKLVNAFLSFIISTVFVSAVGPRLYILAIIPWFAVLIVGLFLFMALVGFLGKDVMPTKAIGITFVIIMAVIFVISAIFVFSSYYSPYLPWNSGEGANPDALHVVGWIFSPSVGGAILLLGISAVVAWILVKAK